MHIVAASVTAYARNCLAQLNRGIHTLYGFTNGEKLIEQDAMMWQPDRAFKVKKVKKGETADTTEAAFRWYRNFYDKQEGCVSRVV